MDRPVQEVPLIGAVDAHVAAPPSKSVTQRALILAALATGSSRLLHPLDSGDTRRLAKALEDLGIPVRRDPGSWEVSGSGGQIPAPGARVDAGEAGTAARFLCALVALGRGRFLVDGSERMRRRPILPLVKALTDLGVGARCLGRDGCPPVEVMAAGLPGGRARIRGGQSSQYLSALLLVSPRAASPVRVQAEGDVTSAPYVRLTVAVMGAFGVPPREDAPFVFDFDSPVDYSGRDYGIEGDYSSAGYFFAAAAVTGGRVRVGDLDPDSAQPDRAILDALGDIGCGVEREVDGWTVTGGDLQGFDLDLGGMPDAAPTLAVVALFARGGSRLRGLGTLRIKETDRVAALARELRKLGAVVTEGPDFLEIRPSALRGAEIETYNDHRMAMSFTVAGLRLPGVSIRDPACVAKSFPSFWQELDRLRSRAG